jgi:hypothetical protein
MLSKTSLRQVVEAKARQDAIERLEEMRADGRPLRGGARRSRRGFRSLWPSS